MVRIKPTSSHTFFFLTITLWISFPGKVWQVFLCYHSGWICLENMNAHFTSFAANTNLHMFRKCDIFEIVTKFDIFRPPVLPQVGLAHWPGWHKWGPKRLPQVRHQRYHQGTRLWSGLNSPNHCYLDFGSLSTPRHQSYDKAICYCQCWNLKWQSVAIGKGWKENMKLYMKDVARFGYVIHLKLIFCVTLSVLQ